MNGAEGMGHGCIQTGNIRFSVDNGMKICYNVVEIIGNGYHEHGYDITEVETFRRKGTNTMDCNSEAGK